MKTLSLILLSGLLISSIYIDKAPNDAEQTLHHNLSPEAFEALNQKSNLLIDQTFTEGLFPGQLSVLEAQNFLNETMQNQFLEAQLKDQNTNLRHLETENEAMNTYLKIGWLAKLFESKTLKK